MKASLIYRCLSPSRNPFNKFCIGRICEKSAWKNQSVKNLTLKDSIHCIYRSRGPSGEDWLRSDSCFPWMLNRHGWAGRQPVGKQRWANVACKGADNKYFRLCEPCGLLTTQLCLAEAAVNKWVGLCSNKTLHAQGQIWHSLSASKINKLLGWATGGQPWCNCQSIVSNLLPCFPATGPSHISANCFLFWGHVHVVLKLLCRVQERSFTSSKHLKKKVEDILAHRPSGSS